MTYWELWSLPRKERDLGEVGFPWQHGQMWGRQLPVAIFNSQAPMPAGGPAQEVWQTLTWLVTQTSQNVFKPCHPALSSTVGGLTTWWQMEPLSGSRLHGYHKILPLHGLFPSRWGGKLVYWLVGRPPQYSDLPWCCPHALWSIINKAVVAFLLHNSVVCVFSPHNLSLNNHGTANRYPQLAVWIYILVFYRRSQTGGVR